MYGHSIVFMSLQRDTVPTRVFPLAQGRWAASTALKTLLLITAAGDLSCVVPSSENVRKVAHGVGQSLPAKVTLDLLPGSALPWCLHSRTLFSHRLTLAPSRFPNHPIRFLHSKALPPS